MAYQRLPRHMQRRAMSHDPKRLPVRLREIFKAQVREPAHSHSQVSPAILRFKVKHSTSHRCFSRVAAMRRLSPASNVIQLFSEPLSPPTTLLGFEHWLQSFPTNLALEADLCVFLDLGFSLVTLSVQCSPT